MIVAMKKLDILLCKNTRENFFKDLQRFGFVDFDRKSDFNNNTLRESENKLEKLNRIKTVIKKLSGDNLSCLSVEQHPGIDQIISDFEEKEQKLSKVAIQIDVLRSEINRVQPWGNYDPELVLKFEKKGLHTLFLEMEEKRFKSWNNKEYLIKEVKSEKGKIYFLLFYKNEKPSIPAKEHRRADISANELKRQSDQLEIQFKECQRVLVECKCYEKLINYSIIELKNIIALFKVSLSSKKLVNEKVEYFNGWFPASEEKNVVSLLQKHDVWFHIANPKPGDAPPVLLKNPYPVKLFESVTRIFSLPGYYELDPTPFFAPFFALFFGLCLADFGYGVIMIIVSTVMIFVASPALKPIFHLGTVLGLTTVLGGILLNTVFGYPIYIFEGTNSGILQSTHHLAFLGPYMKSGKLVFPALPFSLFVGTMQVYFGIILQAWNNAKNQGLLYIFKPLSFLILIPAGFLWAVHRKMINPDDLTLGSFEAGKFIQEINIQIIYGMFIVSGLLLMFFNNPQMKIYKQIPMALWELYGFITGLMGDILSYLRLFALGLAGGLLGNSFNTIALMFVTNKDHTIHYTVGGTIAMVLVMLFGHTLNFGLSILGGFVHSLRLTFVEFYRNLQFQGGGKPYTPLKYED